MAAGQWTDGAASCRSGSTRPALCEPDKSSPQRMQQMQQMRWPASTLPDKPLGRRPVQCTGHAVPTRPWQPPEGGHLSAAGCFSQGVSNRSPRSRPPSCGKTIDGDPPGPSRPVALALPSAAKRLSRAASSTPEARSVCERATTAVVGARVCACQSHRG